MDERQLRKLAGLKEAQEETLTEAFGAAEYRSQTKGPNISVYADRSLAARGREVTIYANYSSGKIEVKRPGGKIGEMEHSEAKDALDKEVKEKLDQIVRLHKKYEADVEKILKK